MGVGRGSGDDSHAAARSAARDAQVGPDTKLFMVFAAITHDPAAIADGLREAAPGVPVVGCSTHGEIGPGGPGDGTVTVAAIGGPGFAVSTASATDVAGRQREAGSQVAHCADDVAGLPYRVLLLLTDGLVAEQESILRGCYLTLGAGVPLFGGAAADAWQLTGTYLLHDGAVLGDAVVAAAIASEAPLSIAVKHGWRTVGEPMVVTRAENGRVYTLDDRPALDAYLDRLGAPPEAYHDAAAFQRFSLARPLGVNRRSGVEARNLITDVDFVGRTIGGGSSIEHGGLVWPMDGDEESILSATDGACEEALAGLGGAPAVGMLTFSCAALRAVLGEDIRLEGERLARWAGPVPYAGCYSYGEIARTRGIDGFHHQTFAVLALS
jgi:hypothetical protein